MGAEYVQRVLGVSLQAGGEHARMGTHNLLLGLGAAAYLEVISIDPTATPPGRRRWFGLDDYGATALPRLSAWVARTADIEQSVAATAEDLGIAESMSRGELEWRITLPAGGRPALDGVAPALIQWPTGVHPAPRLKDVGCRLRRLETFHSEATRVRALFDKLGLADAVSVAALPPDVGGYLSATIDTPAGARILTTPGGRSERP
jgi:Glyoxalase-like domain